MTIKLSSLKADLARESEGDWIEYPQWEGVAFKVSSFHKPAYVIAQNLLLQSTARKSKGKPQSAADIAPAYGKLYCTHILHDWRGFDIPYSPDTAMEVMTDPAYREVFEAVEWCARQVAVVNAEFVEEATKNSAPPSGGNSRAKEQATG